MNICEQILIFIDDVHKNVKVKFDICVRERERRRRGLLIIEAKNDRD